MQFKLGLGKVLAEYDKEILKYFSDMKVFNEEGEASTVPAAFANDQKIEMMTDGSVVQKITLPQIYLYRKDLFRFSSRWQVEYQLTFCSMYRSDMDQMLEQLMLRFSPHAEVVTKTIGEIDLEINKYPPRDEKDENNKLKIYRHDWKITTEVKLR